MKDVLTYVLSYAGLTTYVVWDKMLNKKIKR